VPGPPRSKWCYSGDAESRWLFVFYSWKQAQAHAQSLAQRQFAQSGNHQVESAGNDFNFAPKKMNIGLIHCFYILILILSQI
jgi:hypothetical protein